MTRIQALLPCGRGQDAPLVVAAAGVPLGKSTPVNLCAEFIFYVNHCDEFVDSYSLIRIFSSSSFCSIGMARP
jgi:hypothetical protein